MSRSTLHWVVVILGAFLLTGILGTCYESRGEEQAATPQSLAKKISVDLAAKPFTQAIDELAKAANVQIQLDNFALKEIGFNLNEPITFKLSGASLRSVLRHLLHDFDLTYVLRDEYVLITTPDEANKSLVSRVYNVRDLIGTVNKLTDEYDYDPIIDLVTATVKPTSWNLVGGAGSIRGFQDTLVVSQTQGIHEEIAALIAALRQVRGLQMNTKQGFEPVVVGDGPEQAAIRKGLDQAVTFDDTERSLGEWATLLSDKYGLPIVFDRKAMADVGLSTDSRVKAKAVNMSLQTALKLLLRTVDLTFVVQDDAILITTPDEANKAIQYWVFKVPDLAMTHDEHGQERADYKSLIDAITTAVKPTAWDRVGGVGNIKGFDAVKAIVVAQIGEFQPEIDRLIRQLRAARLEQETQAPPDRSKSSTPEYFVGRYELVLPKSVSGESNSVGQIIHVIKDLVEPASWKQDGGYIEGVGTTLVVRQTPEVHRQVAKLLKDLRFLGDAVPTRGSDDSGTQYRRVRPRS